MYEPVACLSTNSSFIYVVISYWNGFVRAYDLEPSCGYLATTPLGGRTNGSYKDVVELMKEGFGLGFPFTIGEDIGECLAKSMR
jgi:hypothetical protein